MQTIPNGIQRGAVTHHQDQSMTLVSLSIRKVRNRKKPIGQVTFESFITKSALVTQTHPCGDDLSRSGDRQRVSLPAV